MRKRVVIIGGGAIGCSIAYFLSKDSARDVEVTVIERDPTYRIASSALSASSIRQQFFTPESVMLSQFGFAFIQDVERQKEKYGSGVDFNACNYLFVARQGEAAHLRNRSALVRSLGVEIEEFDQQSLQKRYPWMATDDLTYGVRGVTGEGWFDGYSLMQWYRKRAREAGVNSVSGDAAGYRVAGSRIVSVKMADGTEIEGDDFVVAAGAWSQKLTASLGIEVPIRPRRRSAFVISSPEKIEDLPILIDTSGVFVRREQSHYLAVVSPSAEKDHDELPLDPDFSEFDDIIWPMLAERIPGFEALRVEHAWAGYYEYNTLDQNGIVGRIGPENSFIAAGFSGHGLMHSPGTGRAVSELIQFGEYRSIDLSDFSFDRFAQGKLIVEHSVY